MIDALGKALSSGTSRLTAVARRFAASRSGVGAVEFAIIAPLLLMLYITAFELTIGLGVAKRASRSAGSIADLVTQQKSVSKAYLGTMKDVAAAIFVPHRTTDMTLKVSGIAVDANGNATIAWSWKQDGTRAYTAGNSVTVPKDLRTPNSFLVHSELSVPHQLLMFMPGLVPPEMRSINIGRDYYFRQRTEDKITCTDC